MKKVLLFLAVFLMPLCVTVAKTTYTYKLVKVSTEPTENDQYVYPNASNHYVFKIELNPAPSGFAKGKFTVELENAKFSDGTIKIENINENNQLSVVYDDILNQNGIIKITNANAIDTSAVILAVGDRTQFSYAIASLKGQTPTVAITGASNPPMGSKIQLTAEVLGDFIYPGIYKKNEFGMLVNKTVRKFEWTLPPNWKTVPQGLTGTFTTGIDVKQIIVEPDYFTSGAIQVRGVNDVGTAFSEPYVKNYDRGFVFTNFPTSLIPFGQTATYTFAVTPFAGVIFEWQIPSGWQINGQGNVLEGINMNSISVTTTGFCSNSSVVKVRLKKDNEISAWFTCTYPGVSLPTITNNTSAIYQYENASFTISNISISGISSITWSGDGVTPTYNQGSDSKIAFAKSGTITLNANIFMNGCSTPVVLSKVVTVNANRLSMLGSVQLCNQGDYSINLPIGNTITWSGTPENVVSIQQNGSNATLTKLTDGRVVLSATINQIPAITKEIIIGSPVQLCVSSISNLTMEDWDTGYLKMLPQSGGYPYGGSLSIIDWYYLASSYQWTLAVSPPAGKTVFWSSNGGTVNVSTKSASTGITLTCTASNSCGSISKNFRFHTDNFVPFLLSLSPNPVSSQVEVALVSDVSETTLLKSSTSESLTATSYSVSVVDSYGSTVYSGTKKDKKFTIPTSTFRNGIYAVIVSDGKKVYQNKLVVKH